MEKSKICRARPKGRRAPFGLHDGFAGLSGNEAGVWRYFTNFQAAFEKNVRPDARPPKKMAALAAKMTGDLGYMQERLHEKTAF